MLLVLSQQIRPSNFFVLFCFFFVIILNFVVDEFEIFSASFSDGVDRFSSLPTGSKLNVPLESLLCHSFFITTDLVLFPTICTKMPPYFCARCLMIK